MKFHLFAEHFVYRKLNQSKLIVGNKEWKEKKNAENLEKTVKCRLDENFK